MHDCTKTEIQLCQLLFLPKSFQGEPFFTLELIIMYNSLQYSCQIHALMHNLFLAKTKICILCKIV